MEQLKSIKECLVSQVQNQLGDIKKVNAKELGEVVDMIKDLEEAMYYCSIVEAMEKTQEEKEGNMYYGGRRMYYDSDSSMPTTGHNSSISNGHTSYYTPYMEYAPYMMRDEGWRESHLPHDGRSYQSRRMYMESTKDNSMKELEHYIKDLGDDLTDMIRDSSQEEKQILSTKLQQLATKINNNVK